jgi:hypothetical protein
MNSKSILIAAVLAVVFVIAGYFATRSESSKAAETTETAFFLPGLYDRINDVVEVRITTSEGDFHVRREDDAWTLVERYGYPVQVEKVRATLIGLAELKVVEEKTSDPARYSELGVQAVGGDPSAEFQSREITLTDKIGATIAALVVGKPRGGGGGGTFYVRRSAESPSWLVKGKLPSLPSEGDEWLDKEIIELKRNDVRAARITHADGEVLTISQLDSEKDFSVHGLPEGRELTYASAPGGIAGALQYMNFEDVTRLDEFEAPESPLAVSDFWTKDGLRVTVRLWEKDEKPYIALAAAYDLDGTPSTVIGPLPPPAEGEAQAEATPRPRAEVEAEVAALNERLAPWVFELPTYSKTNLTKRLEGLLKPLPEAEQPEGSEDLDEDAPLDIDSLGGPLDQPTDDPSDG